MKKIVLLCALLGGCVSTGVVPMGQDTYLISKQSAGGIFVPASAVKAEILREANDYCISQNRNLQIVHTQELNAVPGFRMPSAELQFMCLHASDPELTRTRLHRDSDQILEMRNR